MFIIVLLLLLNEWLSHSPQNNQDNSLPMSLLTSIGLLEKKNNIFSLWVNLCVLGAFDMTSQITLQIPVAPSQVDGEKEND